MQNEFIVIKEKIMEIQEEEQREIVDSGVLAEQKILEEIENLKAEHEKVQNSVEGKSKIEQMKAMLQLTSIESSISLKNIELKELKENNLNNNDSEQKQHERCLNQLKEDFVNYLKEVENKIDKTIKGEENEVALTKDFLDVQEYYKNIKASESKEKEEIYAKNRELNKKMEPARQKYFELLNKGDIIQKKALPYCGDTKNQHLFDRYMAEAQKKYNKADEYKIQNLDVYLKKQEEYNKILDTMSEKSKITNMMIDEMISELIKEELKQREIVIPEFVKDTRFFKNRYED